MAHTKTGETPISDSADTAAIARVLELGKKYAFLSTFFMAVFSAGVWFAFDRAAVLSEYNKLQKLYEMETTSLVKQIKWLEEDLDRHRKDLEEERKKTERLRDWRNRILSSPANKRQPIIAEDL